jgi:hypothetical protein
MKNRLHLYLTKDDGAGGIIPLGDGDKVDIFRKNANWGDLGNLLASTWQTGESVANLYFTQTGMLYGDVEMAEIDVWVNQVKQDIVSNKAHLTGDVITHVQNNDVHKTLSEIKTYIEGLMAAVSTNNIDSVTSIANLIIALDQIAGSIPSVSGFLTVGDLAGIESECDNIKSELSSLKGSLQTLYVAINGDENVNLDGKIILEKNMGSSGLFSSGTWKAIDDILLQSKPQERVRVFFKAIGSENGTECGVKMTLDGSIITSKMVLVNPAEDTYSVDFFLGNQIQIHNYEIIFYPLAGSININSVIVEKG